MISHLSARNPLFFVLVHCQATTDCLGAQSTSSLCLSSSTCCTASHWVPGQHVDRHLHLQGLSVTTPSLCTANCCLRHCGCLPPPPYWAVTMASFSLIPGVSLGIFSAVWHCHQLIRTATCSQLHNSAGQFLVITMQQVDGIPGLPECTATTGQSVPQQWLREIYYCCRAKDIKFQICSHPSPAEQGVCADLGTCSQSWQSSQYGWDPHNTFFPPHIRELGKP